MILFNKIPAIVPHGIYLGAKRATYEKAVIVSEALAQEFRNFIIGSEVIQDGKHGWVVAIYQTVDLPKLAIPHEKEEVKILLKITPIRKKNR